MSIFQAIILGIVQGLTEFLPISSSAHLVLVPFFAGWKFPEQEAFAFDVIVQLGTLLAVIVYFWKDLFKIALDFVAALLKGKPFADPNARLGWWIILATIPAGLFGILIKKLIEAAFGSVVATACFLFVTAVLLFVGEVVGKKNRSLEDMTWKDALIIGCFQAISVFPGISRSGSTMTGAMICNYTRAESARFSFLMSIPIMTAAGILSIFDLLEMPALVVTGSLPTLLAGTIVAAVVGFFCIHWLLNFLKKSSLLWFALYCVLLGSGTLFYIWYVLRIL